MVWTTLAAFLVSAIAVTTSPTPQIATRRVLALDGVLGQRTIPANAIDLGDRWVCEYGYRKVARGCVEIEVPVNGVLRGYGWVCRDGYREVDGACVAIEIPQNAHAIGNSWFCDVGYRRVDTACESAEIEIPKNARRIGVLYWMCNNGYLRSGNECVAIDMPDNAIAIGGVWECGLGFRQQDNECVEMPEEETQAILEELRVALPPLRGAAPEYLWRVYVVWGRSTRPDQLLNDRLGGNIVEVSCQVHRLANGQVRLECVGERARAIRDHCYVLMFGDEGRLECNPASLSRLGGYGNLGYCRVVMKDEAYGRFDCRRRPGGF